MSQIKAIKQQLFPANDAMINGISVTIKDEPLSQLRRFYYDSGNDITVL